MDAMDYPHFVSLALVVAISTLAAGWWAERRRHRTVQPKNLFVELLLALAFMLFYATIVYLLPAIIVASFLWGITSVPHATGDVVLAETVAQLATLFSIGSNFADVASTFGRVAFWRHMRQYAVFVLPGYYATMAIAWLGAAGLARGGHFAPENAARIPRLFALPLLAPHPILNLLLCAAVLIGVGAVSYLLRRRGEAR